ncbi:MAG: RNA polymerase sigma factor [Myxococcales bacterium]|nr:RNA polymerase sigma factor [Myxococcales bacterium]
MSRLLAFPRPKAAELDDAVLLAAGAAGDMDAFAALFDRHHEALHRFVLRLGFVDAQDVDDLLQTTFVQIFRAADGFRERSQVRTWMMAIAANVSRRHVRTVIRRRRLLQNVSERPTLRPVGPAAALEQAERQRRLQAAIAALPHKLRVVFVLCEVEGVPGVEAAAGLDLPTGTLYRRLHEARRSLRAALAEGAP